MKIAETVTFGGSALDRRAEMRGNAQALGDLAKRDGAGCVPFWRGKPLILGQDDGIELARIAASHPIFQYAQTEPVFLGIDGENGVWARDVSAWVPEDLDEAQLGQFLDATEQTHPSLPNGERFAELRAVMTRLSPRDAEIAATAKAVLGWHISHKFCAKCGQPSEMAMAGWQRNCPACNAQHFPRTDPVVIMLITHGNDVLVGRSPFWPEGMFSLLAGFIEPGEPIEAAVRREVFEESGVRVGEVSYLASQPWPFPASLMFGCHGHATTREITIDPNEIEEAMWISKERLALIFDGKDPQINAPRNGAIAHFILWNWLSDRLD